MRPVCLAVTFLSLTSYLGFAAITGINSSWTDSFGAGVTGGFTNESGVLLSAGSALDGDGTIIQFGVFNPAIVPAALDPASYTDAEWAAFLPLTGEGSPNPQFDTTIGDGVSTFDGFYDIGVTFDTNMGATGLPASPARIGIRVFNNTSLATSTTWNTVTHSSVDWVLNPPAEPFATPANAFLDPHVDPSTGASSLTWEGGAASAFITTVPEPSASLLGLLGAALFLRRRRWS